MILKKYLRILIHYCKEKASSYWISEYNNPTKNTEFHRGYVNGFQEGVKYVTNQLEKEFNL